MAPQAQVPHTPKRIYTNEILYTKNNMITQRGEIDYSVYCPLVRVEQKSDKHSKPYISKRLTSGSACHSSAMFALRSRASHRVIELFAVTQLGNSTSAKALWMVYLTASFVDFPRPTVINFNIQSLPSRFTDELKAVVINA